MSTPHGLLVVGLLLASTGMAGCLDDGEPENHRVSVATHHDPNLTDEEERPRTPGEGFPARTGTVNAFLFEPDDLEAMEWGLWDPVAPPQRGPDEPLSEGNASGAFPLDEQGTTRIAVDAPEGTVLALWVWGSSDAEGAGGCEGQLYYVSPDAPAATVEIGDDRRDVSVEVPFGMGCTDGG